MQNIICNYAAQMRGKDGQCVARASCATHPRCPKAKTRKLILDYGFFTVDDAQNVTIAGKKDELLSLDSVPTAPAYNIDDYISLEEDKKEKREDKKKLLKRS